MAPQGDRQHVPDFFEDGAGVTHTVSVAASSLYEVAALKIAEFKRCGFGMATIGPATRLRVAVEAPAMVHELNVSRFQAWLEAGAKNAAGAGRES